MSSAAGSHHADGDGEAAEGGDEGGKEDEADEHHTTAGKRKEKRAKKEKERKGNFGAKTCHSCQLSLATFEGNALDHLDSAKARRLDNNQAKAKTAAGAKKKR